MENETANLPVHLRRPGDIAKTPSRQDAKAKNKSIVWKHAPGCSTLSASHDLSAEPSTLDLGVFASLRLCVKC